MIESLLSTDAYKFYMAQLYFNKFSHVKAVYKFICRSPVVWPDGFWANIQEIVSYCEGLRFHNDEMIFLAQMNLFSPAYLDWLYKTPILDPEAVKFNAGLDGKVEVSIEGPIYKTVFWEVPLLAIISELYHKCNSSDGFLPSPAAKVAAFDACGVPWADFGTRRRYSGYYQNLIVSEAKQSKNFIGTSNVYLAMRHKVPVIGTMAHEFPMLCAALYGVENANRVAMSAWEDLYRDKLNCYLPDTYSTNYCLQRDGYLLVDWGATRQDSGSPFEYVDKMLRLYKAWRVDATQKKIIFSDGLTPEKIIEIRDYVDGRIQSSFGIGTNLTNSPNAHPLNAVIKLDEVDGVKVAKIGDGQGKETGDPVAVERAKRIIGYAS